MTSQLILLNGFGVALATDSAVTLGQKRTYDTAEKLIPLPAPHRIAVLHSGSVFLHGMPFSVLVNEWATTLGETPLRTVDLYRQNFLSWLDDNHDWVSHQRLVDDYMRQFNGVLRIIWEQIKENINESESDEIAVKSALDVLHHYVDIYLRAPSLSRGGEEWLKTARRRIEKEIENALNYWFDDIPHTDEIDSLIQQFSDLYLDRGHRLNIATLAFTGFGNKELLPGFANVDIHGIFNSTLLYRLERAQNADTDGGENYFGICPIGQKDAIDLVLRGLNYSLVDVATDAATVAVGKHMAQQNPDLIEGKPENYPPEELVDHELGHQIYDAIREAFVDYSEERNLSSLRTAISALPTASLAAVARSLIELQSLTQTITGEMGTVGGPVDVATISRDAGFVWVRHKSINV
jgi:hypothetical protein